MQEQLLARAERLERFTQADPHNAVLRLDLARTYHLAGRHETALDALDAMDGAEGSPPRLVALRGELLLALGRWRDAADFYRQALVHEPASAPILFNLAYAHWAADEPEAASAAIEQALAQASGDARTLQLAAQIHLEQGRLEQAALCAERSVAAASGSAEAWHTRGTIALFALDAASAWKHLRHALDLAPEDVDIGVSLAQAAFMQGRARQARQLLEDALRRQPGHEAALCLLAWACLSDGDHARASELFRQATIEAPQNAEAWAGRAVLALAAEHREAAQEAAERALALDAQQPIAALVRAGLQQAGAGPEVARASVEAVLGTRLGGPVQGDWRALLQSAPARGLLARQQRRLKRQSRAAVHTPPPGAPTPAQDPRP